MLPVAISHDILAIRCIKDFIVVGVGNQLRIFRAADHKFLRSIETFHADVIHNIVKCSAKLIVFGGRHLSIFTFDIKSAEIILKRETSHSFNDWIIAAEFFSENSDQIYILFSHNNLYLFNTLTKQFRNVQCKERCISYGGYLSRETSKDLLVFSCTVFQEILLWKVDNRIDYSSDITVLHRLKGHKGVIFSVFYDPQLRLITSTSDDRTIRLWKVVEKDVNPISNSIEWRNAEVRLLTTMFGHTARVWKSIITENNVVSIGEDSLICIWSQAGALHNKLIAHGGAPIWSLEISPDKTTIITGGGDGGVNIWPLSALTSPSLTPTFTYENKTPKFVGYLNSGALTVFLDGGDLLLYSQYNQASQPRATISLPRLKSYCLMQISPDREKIAFASRDGHIIIFADRTNEKDSTEGLHQILDQKVIDSKIFSFQWLSNEKLLICGPQGALKILNLTKNHLEIDSEFTLPPSKECWTTSAIISSTLLICGDRTGSIIVYQCTPTSSTSPKQIFSRIHGRLGVQSFGLSGDKIISTGRDGTLRFHNLLENGSGEFLKPLHWRKTPMEWVSRSVNAKDDVFILGFKEIEFMIYSTRLDKLLLRVVCGGGHRSWDCVFNETTIHFVCIKDKQVHSLDNISIASSATIISGFHSKEINSLAILPSFSKHIVVMSGSEDCSIRISLLYQKNSSRYDLMPLDIYDGHISSVKQIEILNLEMCEKSSRSLVFSGGGRAQLKVWEVLLTTCEETLTRDDVVGVELTSFMLRGTDRDRRKFPQSKGYAYFLDPETRFMDISAQLCPKDENLVILFVACSDGFIRVFCYDIEGVNLFFVDEIEYYHRCILKVQSFRDERGLILISMATDGFINFWDVNFVVEKVVRKNGLVSNADCCGGVQPFGRWKAHQSGINSYDFLRHGTEYFLASGGDDNKASFSVFEVTGTSENREVRVKRQWESSEIHSAQITGIKFLPNDQLLTTAIDQRVVLYDYNYSKEKLSVTPKKIIQTFVSDLQGLTICNNPSNDNGTLAFVYGQGVEVLYHEHKI